MENMNTNFVNLLDSIFDENTFFETKRSFIPNESKYGNLLKTKNDYFVDKKDNHYILEMALPGYNKEDLNIVFEKNDLIISQKKDDASKNRWAKNFKKYFSVSDDIKKSDISAKLEKGILTITLPKKKEVQPKSIVID